MPRVRFVEPMINDMVLISNDTKHRECTVRAATLKTRHELVAQALANGKSQADAYRSAGYIYKPSNANRLCRSPAVEARVQELLRERTESQAKARDVGMQPR